MPYKFENGFNIKLFVITASILLLVSYGIFNARSLITGPTIEIFSPVTETETNEKVITIRGKAENMSFISMNEKPIFVDGGGLFEEKLLLSPGSNIIEIKAKDRFKKEVSKVIKIYYKQN